MMVWFRWFSFSRGPVFSGSMLIFRGVMLFFCHSYSTLPTKINQWVIHWDYTSMRLLFQGNSWWHSHHKLFLRAECTHKSLSSFVLLNIDYIIIYDISWYIMIHYDTLWYIIDYKGQDKDILELYCFRCYHLRFSCRWLWGGKPTGLNRIGGHLVGQCFGGRLLS